MLIGQNIRKGYGGLEILHGIDISLAPKQITAILGPSGGGKSTLLRALSILDAPDSGSIEVDGVEYAFPITRKNGIQPPWPTLTVVFQQLFLWPHLTLRRNITLPLDKLRAKSNGAAAEANNEVEALLDLFELSEQADRYPNEVSLGQRQRAAFIRAVVLHPKYLLLDEITSALDVEHVSKILEHLKSLRDQGTGILLVTHLIGFAKSAADQIIFLEKGRVVESGDRSLLTITKNERLRKFLSLVETAL
jgi:ABC-type polar amino acid transport system ATPase subunit